MAEGFPVPDSSKEPEEDRSEVYRSKLSDQAVVADIESDLTALGSEFRRLLDPEVLNKTIYLARHNSSHF